jgi:hypothetical protein
MKRVLVKILNEGDEVIGTEWRDDTLQITVRHENGDVEIFSLYEDEDGLPRLDNTSTLITEGEGEVEISKSKDSGGGQDSEDDVKVSTF